VIECYIFYASFDKCRLRRKIVKNRPSSKAHCINIINARVFKIDFLVNENLYELISEVL